MTTTSDTPASAAEPQTDDELLVSVVIPCLNEEENITQVVTHALEVMAREGIAGEVVVADNASEDRSAELATAAQEGIKINVAIINNGYRGMVRQGQEFFYERRYMATPMRSPDFVKLAEAYGLTGIRVSSRSEVEPAIRRAEEDDQAVVIDFRVEQEIEEGMGIFRMRRASRNGQRILPKERALVWHDIGKVLILGQDPYHNEGQANGLCFSVRPPTRPPPSLRNIFRELESDLGIPAPKHGDLTAWAHQGVLLLNTVLTVEAHKAASHAGKGWERFTDAVIEALNRRNVPLVFCFWGAHARKKVCLIDTARHPVVQAAHPSPLSQKKFLGSRPFSTINAALVSKGLTAVEWRIH